MSRRAPKRKGQSAELAGAVEAFLDALELPREVRAASDLAGTPRRVAEAWREDLLDGYRQDPAAILADSMPATSRALVAVTGIDFHSMCPHHLLPSRGVAHVAYVPGERVVGFGQIARLVDALAHRLVLEEDLARDVAEALVREHVLARADHRTLNDFLDNPTAENIARWIWEALDGHVPGLCEVKLYEIPGCAVTYRGPGR